MNEQQLQNGEAAEMTQEQLSELLQIRRDKLTALCENGENPYEVTKYDVTAYTTTARAEDEKQEAGHFARDFFNRHPNIPLPESNFLGKKLIEEIKNMEMKREDFEIMAPVGSRESLAAAINAISKALADGDKIQLVGFGTFEVRERAARTGKNPRTGEMIKIAASKVPAFKAGKALKDFVNG